jgi:uncharacterized protein (DUF1800 family)
MVSYVRIALLVFVCLTSTAVHALDFPEARHLLLRAGFGPEPALMQQLASLDREQAVQFLLHEPPVMLEAPGCVSAQIPDVATRKHWSKAQRRDYRKQVKACGRELKRWYVRQLVSDKAVLKEQMTLFWHNHFTVALKKVREPQLIMRQHQMLQRHALGRFDQLLLEVLRDPAMLIYLDNVNNRKQKPNENLARELLELFTLGVGHYSEQDIREVARALTGLTVDRTTYDSVLRLRQHDKRDKTFLGATGKFGVEGVVDVILRQPQTAKFIARKVWLNFVSVADETEISRLAAEFALTWDIGELVRQILLSSQFWNNPGQMIKSPVELAVGSARVLGSHMLPDQGVPALLTRMGQDLFDPPNVKGWPGGNDWVDASRLLVRINFGERITRALGDEAMMSQLAYLCGAPGVSMLSAVAPLAPTPAGAPCQQQLDALVTDPVWQLK